MSGPRYGRHTTTDAPPRDESPDSSRGEAAIAYLVGNSLADGGMPGLRRLAADLIREEQIVTFLELTRLMDSHNIRDAEAAYRIVIDSEAPEYRAQALLEYAQLVARYDRNTAAEALLEAVQTEDPDVAPRAALALGQLVEDQSPEGAAGAYFKALQSNDEEVVAYAGLRAGLLLEDYDPAAAEAAYRRAVATRQPVHAKEAALALGANLVEEGRSDEAVELLVFAVESDDPSVRDLASLQLGDLRRETDPEAAARDYARAAVSTQADVAALASADLGLLQVAAGDTDEGVARVRDIMDGDTAVHISPRLNLQIGIGLKDADPDLAERALRLASGSSDETVAPDAALRLGLRLLATERTEEGRRVLLAGVESGHASGAPRCAAALCLSDVLRGDVPQEARYWSLARSAMFRGSAGQILAAGVEREVAGDPVTARAAYELAAHSDDDEIRRLAEQRAAALQSGSGA